MGQKRSASEAFQSQPRSVRESLQQHRSKSRNGLSQPKTVDYQDKTVDSDSGNGAPSKEFNTSPHHRVNLKQRARDLLPVRQQLPIAPHADAIRAKLRHHDVLLLVGETGSGKSTQLPQFLVDEPWCQRQVLANRVKVGGCIAITQPRRVAAISLARRVAEEMGTPLGTASPASQVGYAVRFENCTGPNTRVKFLTEGMLLQEMLRDPWLKEYSCVVVDEVHERGVNVDLVLGFLRRLRELRSKDDPRGGVGVKVVIMSATADMEKIRDYFSVERVEESISQSTESTSTTTATANGDIHDEQEEWSGFSDGDKKKPGKEKATTKTKTKAKANGISQQQPPSAPQPATSLHIKGRQYPVTITYAPSAVPDVLDAVYSRILDIHSHSPLPGDILVFLPGQEPIDSLLSLLNAYSHKLQKDPALSRTLPQLLTLPLYAALPTALQQRVFLGTPKRTRKIILSTNIAETSLTVPGIRHVIDTGLAKQRLFRPSLNLDTLLTVPISRSSAAQRAGRAGRDAPGTAHRLYTEPEYLKLQADTEPEILRCDLSQLVLTLKAHGITDVAAFPLLTPPARRALERALVHLLQLNALSPADGTITPVGREMSLLPLPAPLARALLASADPHLHCVDEMIDIVSALSVENIFLGIHAAAVRGGVADTTSGNHSTMRKNTGLISSTSGAADADGTGGDAGDHAEAAEQSRESRAADLRRNLTRREGDHLTLLATVQAYAAEQTDRKRWCAERMLSHRALSSAMDVRKQLRNLMARYLARSAHSASAPAAGGVPLGASRGESTEASMGRSGEVSAEGSSEYDPTLPTRILRALLTALHPNTARLAADHTYRTLLTNQPVAIHPSSVLFSAPPSAPTHSSHHYHRKVPRGSTAANDDGNDNENENENERTAHRGTRKFEAIMYSEFVYTGTKAYARGVSAVELGWVSEIIGGNR